MRSYFYFLVIILSFNLLNSQDYFLENNGPYIEDIQSPEEFLGYDIGFEHTRHDLIVAYLNYLSNVSEKAELIKYGGKLILEIAYNQKKEVKQLLNRNGFYVNSVIKDFAKNDRCIISTKLEN